MPNDPQVDKTPRENPPPPLRTACGGVATCRYSDAGASRTTPTIAKVTRDCHCEARGAREPAAPGGRYRRMTAPLASWATVRRHGASSGGSRTRSSADRHVSRVAVYPLNLPRAAARLCERHSGSIRGRTPGDAGTVTGPNHTPVSVAGGRRRAPCHRRRVNRVGRRTTTHPRGTTVVGRAALPVSASRVGHDLGDLANELRISTIPRPAAAAQCRISRG